MLSISLVLVACLQLVSAHFAIDYPYWRGDSFTEPASQYIRPCAGLNQSLSNNNRTKWPLNGGSILLDVHHPWAITYVNLALGGDNTTNFNISVVPGFNQTGNGTFCWPTVNLPSGLNLANGANASIQVVQIAETGSALYNCADITFSSDAKILGNNQCINSTGVGGVAITSTNSTSKDASKNSTSSSSSTTASPPTSKSGADVPTAMGLQTMWIAVAAVGLVELAARLL